MKSIIVKKLVITIVITLFFCNNSIYGSVNNPLESKGYLKTLLKVESEKEFDKKYGKYMNEEKSEFYEVEEYAKHLQEMYDARELEGLTPNGLTALFCLTCQMYSANASCPYNMRFDYWPTWGGETEPCPSLFFKNYISDWFAQYPLSIIQIIGSLWFIKKFFKTRYYHLPKKSKEYITYNISILSIFMLGFINEEYLGKYTLIANNDVHNAFAGTGFIALANIVIYDMKNDHFWTKLKKNIKNALNVYGLHVISLLGAVTSCICFFSPALQDMHDALNRTGMQAAHKYIIGAEWTLVLFLALLFTQGIFGLQKGKGNSWKAINIENAFVLILCNIFPLIMSLTNYFGFGFDAVVENLLYLKKKIPGNHISNSL